MMNPNKMVRTGAVTLGMAAGAVALVKYEFPHLHIGWPHSGTENVVEGVHSQSSLTNVANIHKVFLVEGDAKNTTKIDGEYKYTGFMSGLLNHTVPWRCEKTTVYQEGQLQLGFDAGGIDITGRTGSAYHVKVDTSKVLLQLVGKPEQTSTHTDDCATVRARQVLHPGEAHDDQRGDGAEAYGSERMKYNCGSLLTRRLTQGVKEYARADRHLSTNQPVTLTYVNGKGGPIVPEQDLRHINLHEGPKMNLQQLTLKIFGKDSANHKIDNTHDQPCNVSTRVLKQIGGTTAPVSGNNPGV